MDNDSKITLTRRQIEQLLAPQGDSRGKLFDSPKEIGFRLSAITGMDDATTKQLSEIFHGMMKS